MDIYLAAHCQHSLSTLKYHKGHSWWHNACRAWTDRVGQHFNKVPSPLRTVQASYPAYGSSSLLAFANSYPILLWICLWQLPCSKAKFFISLFPPSLSDTLWCKCNSSPFDRLSLHNKHTPFWYFQSVLLVLVRLGMWAFLRTSQYLEHFGLSGDAWFLTIIWLLILVQDNFHI